MYDKTLWDKWFSWAFVTRLRLVLRGGRWEYFAEILYWWAMLLPRLRRWVFFARLLGWRHYLARKQMSLIFGRD